MPRVSEPRKRTDEYRRNAEEAQRSALKSVSETERAAFLKLAADWLQMAASIERTHALR